MAAKTEKCEKFYHSTIWRKTRAQFLNTKHYTCEMCGQVGYLVHHKIPLDDNNVDNPKISLDYNNLLCVCKSCHDKIHHRLNGRGNDNDYFKVKFDKDGNVIVKDSRD